METFHFSPQKSGRPFHALMEKGRSPFNHTPGRLILFILLTLFASIGFSQPVLQDDQNAGMIVVRSTNAQNEALVWNEDKTFYWPLGTNNNGAYPVADASSGDLSRVRGAVVFSGLNGAKHSLIWNHEKLHYWTFNSQNLNATEVKEASGASLAEVRGVTIFPGLNGLKQAIIWTNTKTYYWANGANLLTVDELTDPSGGNLSNVEGVLTGRLQNSVHEAILWTDQGAYHWAGSTSNLVTTELIPPGMSNFAGVQGVILTGAQNGNNQALIWNDQHAYHWLTGSTALVEVTDPGGNPLTGIGGSIVGKTTNGVTEGLIWTNSDLYYYPYSISNPACIKVVDPGGNSVSGVLGIAKVRTLNALNEAFIWTDTDVHYLAMVGLNPSTEIVVDASNNSIPNVRGATIAGTLNSDHEVVFWNDQHAYYWLMGATTTKAKEIHNGFGGAMSNVRGTLTGHGTSSINHAIIWSDGGSWYWTLNSQNMEAHPLRLSQTVPLENVWGVTINGYTSGNFQCMLWNAEGLYYWPMNVQNYFVEQVTSSGPIEPPPYNEPHYTGLALNKRYVDRCDSAWVASYSSDSSDIPVLRNVPIGTQIPDLDQFLYQTARDTTGRDTALIQAMVDLMTTEQFVPNTGYNFSMNNQDSTVNGQVIHVNSMTFSSYGTDSSTMHFDFSTDSLDWWGDLKGTWDSAYYSLQGWIFFRWVARGGNILTTECGSNGAAQAGYVHATSPLNTSYSGNSSGAVEVSSGWIDRNGLTSLLAGNGVQFLHNTQLGSVAENSSMSLLFSRDTMEIVNLVPEERYQGFELGYNYPNPFDQTTRIRYLIPAEVEGVTLRITDLMGNTLALLPLQDRMGEVTFDRGKLASGFYFYTLEWNGERVRTRKMTVLGHR